MIMKPQNREPDFRNLEDVASCRVPSRPTLFEFYLNNRLYKHLAGDENFYPNGFFPKTETIIKAYYNAGYDYATVKASNFFFLEDNTKTQSSHAASKSLNEGFVITDRNSFNHYQWNNPEDFSMDDLKAVKTYLPKGMKLVVFGAGGVEENVFEMVGYENLCMMLYDDPELVSDIFECVGTRLLKYYEMALECDEVGAILSNDDWGFNTQTLLTPSHLRQYVFPWHKKIVELGHRKGRPVFLHSCGNYSAIIEDVIHELKYDARHSYQDNIVPVEEAYKNLKGRIGVLGGIDVDFLSRSSKERVFERARAMLEQCYQSGGYALGSGNSIPEYVPDENYYAMIRAAFEE